MPQKLQSHCLVQQFYKQQKHLRVVAPPPPPLCVPKYGGEPVAPKFSSGAADGSDNATELTFRHQTDAPPARDRQQNLLYFNWIPWKG